jgi:hypothetical protein
MTRIFSTSISALWLCLLVALTLATRCANRPDVLIDGRVYFTDADCYSRMTRVRMVLEHPAAIIRHHDFENYPQGTTPHTTAPFDYLIAALKKILDHGFWITGNRASPWATQTLDLAGAIISPLLGVLTTVFLWFWSRRLRLPYRGMLLVLVAVSPILVHGTLLGRPDHQSLLMFLMAVALGAELAMTGGSKSVEAVCSQPSSNFLFQGKFRPHADSKGNDGGQLGTDRLYSSWALAGGTAWGLGLWVSLYEPLILLSGVLALILLFNRRSLFTRRRALEYGIMLGIFALSICIEGWRVGAPDPVFLHYFPNWEKTIGELSRLTPLSPLLFGWAGWLLPAAPVLFALRARADRRAIPLLIFVAATYALTLWQMRWGYFFVLVFAMSLPFQMSVIRWRFAAWALFVAGLWPVAREWDGRLFPDEGEGARIAEERADKVFLRDAAEHLKSEKTLPILAPWWFSPPLVYWSGQPAVGGSSHESLPGIVDAARFFMAEKPETALEILRARKVKRIVAYDSDRVSETASLLLGEPVLENPMARILDRFPSSAPAFLRLEYRNPAFKIFALE